MTWWIALTVYLSLGLAFAIGWVIAVYRDHWNRLKSIRRGQPKPLIMDGKTWFIWFMFFVYAMPVLNLIFFYLAIVRPWWSERKVTIVK